MGSKRLWLWAAATFVMLAGAAGIARPSGDEGRAVSADQRFICVGDYYINGSRIDYAIRECDGIVVVFGSEAGNRLKLTGAAADAMMQWLSSRSVEMRPPAAKEVQKAVAQPKSSQNHQPNSLPVEPIGNEGFRNYQKRMSEKKLHGDK
jgi:hypothetical protein